MVRWGMVRYLQKIREILKIADQVSAGHCAIPLLRVTLNKHTRCYDKFDDMLNQKKIKTYQFNQISF